MTDYEVPGSVRCLTISQPYLPRHHKSTQGSPDSTPSYPYLGSNSLSLLVCLVYLAAHLLSLQPLLSILVSCLHLLFLGLGGQTRYALNDRERLLLMLYFSRHPPSTHSGPHACSHRFS